MNTKGFTVFIVWYCLAMGVTAEPKIIGETVIKGYTALMSRAEFTETSQSHNPKDNPEPNEFVFVDCKRTWVQWSLEQSRRYDYEISDEMLADYEERGCEKLAAGPSNLTVGGIPVQSVSQYQAKPDDQVRHVHDLDNTISFTFDGQHHAKLAGILRNKFGEPYYISDPDNPMVSWFSWSLTSDDMTNIEEWARTVGGRLNLMHSGSSEDFSFGTSILSLKHRDPRRERAFKRNQEDDF